MQLMSYQKNAITGLFMQIVNMMYNEQLSKKTPLPIPSVCCYSCSTYNIQFCFFVGLFKYLSLDVPIFSMLWCTDSLLSS